MGDGTRSVVKQGLKRVAPLSLHLARSRSVSALGLGG